MLVELAVVNLGRMIRFTPIITRRTRIAVRTIVAPEAESITIENSIPSPTLMTPKTGERRRVPLKDLLI